MNHNLHTGEVWVCHEPCCQAKIVVQRGANAECTGAFFVRCCCGKEMTLEATKETAREPALAGARRS